MRSDTDYLGECICGAVCYRIGEVQRAGYCHCSNCREATGGAVVVWAHVSGDDFEVVDGEPATYGATDRGCRAFCDNCGSTLYFEAADRSFFSVCVGTLDEPERLEPTSHICVDSRLNWLEIDDELPRHPGVP